MKTAKQKECFADGYRWLCRSRKKHPASSDIWDFRRTWAGQADEVMGAFWQGRYQFGVQERIMLAGGEMIDMWSSRDALVVKVLTQVLQDRLKADFPRVCYHLKGNGGAKGAVRAVAGRYRQYAFFCKTDVRWYYDSIDHYLLVNKLHDYGVDRRSIGYILQFLKRCVVWGGKYRDVKRGIPRGSSLSPLLGALYLLELDRRLARMNVKYFRFMDDILILAPTRWKLKKAIRVMNQTLGELRLEQHPEKTLIGRTCRGFDFLGYHFGPGGVSLAEKTVAKFVNKALRLYEQEPLHRRMMRLGEYTIRWRGWALRGWGV